MNRDTIISLMALILAFAVFATRIAYPWQLALLAATGVGALTYSALTTWTRMRRVYRPLDASDLMIGETAAPVGDVTSDMEGNPAAKTSYRGGSASEAAND